MAAPPSLRRLLSLRRHRLFSTTNSTTPAAAHSPPPVPVPNTPTPESVLYNISSLSKDPSLALAIFRRSAAAGHPVGCAAYNLMLRTLASDPASAQSHFWPFLRDMQDAGHSVDQGTYLAALASFKKASLTADYASLTAHYTKAQNEAKGGNPISTAAEAVRCLDGSESSAELDSKLEGIDLPLTETAVARVLRELRDYPIKALSFFRWAGRHKGYKHGSVAYNAMARVLGREESVREFWELIEEMKAGEMHVDIDTYVKLSRNFQKRHMLREAVELYELMMDGPFKPSQKDGPVIIRRISLGPSPDLELVNRVVRKFEAVWEFKTKELFDGIHRALTSNGRFDEAAEIVQRMKAEGHRPDNITYSQLVFGLCKANKLDDARKVFDEMEAEGCVPDLKTWTMFIQGHCEAGDVEKALQYLTEMIEKNLDADANLLDVIVKGLCSHDKVDAAYTLFVEMVDKAHLGAWQGTYKHVIGELLRVKKLEEALRLLRSMKARKFPPFADPFPPHIAKYGTFEDAREFLKALTVNNYPSPTAYLYVFKSFFAEGRYSEAQDLLYKCPIHIRKHHDITKLFESIKVESAS
ncbi:pentatricopeptide repeat-containing protein At3g48250, chloroplastic-like [Phragmites australis]|uniref:pentatricopeptide repeat-containing protein At3g48250, chloroplastic-like n=1 Tax=Phragmites australis TaxID=29695 RepID=UPI002D76F247|nr:pentatricopeptide repeat-containing protein At3g48250, chloroplastic-like [Phragmites australis]XP_062208205.1 pentatricopeptide repeat-containing protein At3g48250, chloroplastic-like [Phragmites australis]